MAGRCVSVSKAGWRSWNRGGRYGIECRFELGGVVGREVRGFFCRRVCKGGVNILAVFLSVCGRWRGRIILK